MVNTTDLAGILAASKVTPKETPKTIDTMTQAEIDAITAKQVAAGGSSIDKTLTIPGETNAEQIGRAHV